MRAARAIFRQYLLTALRDRFDLFWTLVFPVILMTLLNLVFANVGNQAAVTMTVGLVNLDQDYPEGVAAIVEKTLLEIGQQETWLKVYQSHNKGQQTELEALEKGKRHIVIVIPAGFSSAVRSNLLLAAGNQPLVPAEIMVYSRPNDQLSKAAVSAFGQVLSGINKSIAIEAGCADSRMLVGFETCEVAVQGRVFSFASYIIPGILIMNFLTTGLSVVVGGLLAYRDRGVLRRYFVTPVSTGSYFLGLLLYFLLTCLARSVVVYLFGALVFHAKLNLLTPAALFYLVYAIIVLLSFGFFIAAAAKNVSAGAAMANIVTYPMMFLGGLFFPVLQAPPVIRWIALVNPVTYLANGLRDALGVYPSETTTLLNVLVPGLWLVFCLLYSLKNFKWEVN